MADRPAIGVDLIIVASLVRLVSKEVNSGVAYSTRVLCVLLEMLQAVRLVPASGEDIKRYLATD